MTNRYLKYTFPATDTQAVCLTQNTAGVLVLNGHLSNSINSEVPFINYGYARQVSITSSDNLSGRTFTVTGYQNNALVTENITGPTAGNTVYGDTAKIYDKITSITVNGAATNVSVGSGYNGSFRLIGINLSSSLGVNGRIVILNPDTQISYTLYASSNLLSQTNQTYATLIANPNIYNVETTSIANATDGTKIFPFNTPFSEIFVTLTGGVATIAHTATLEFRQI